MPKRSDMMATRAAVNTHGLLAIRTKRHETTNIAIEAPMWANERSVLFVETCATLANASSNVCACVYACANSLCFVRCIVFDSVFTLYSVCFSIISNSFYRVCVRFLSLLRTLFVCRRLLSPTYCLLNSFLRLSGLHATSVCVQSFLFVWILFHLSHCFRCFRSFRQQTTTVDKRHTGVSSVQASYKPDAHIFHNNNSHQQYAFNAFAYLRV